MADRLFAVHCFQDGPTLLAALETGLDVRLVLLDWTLPGMTGLAMLDELRRRGVASPVVFLTSASPNEHELVGLQHGAVDFVEKARGIDVLAPRLRRLVAAEPLNPAPQSHGHLVLHPATARAEWRRRDLGFAGHVVVVQGECLSSPSAGAVAADAVTKWGHRSWRLPVLVQHRLANQTATPPRITPVALNPKSCQQA